MVVLENTLRNVFIEGRVTNHSMRAISVTQMCKSGVPEKVIQERTGHKSLDALRVYERTNTHSMKLYPGFYLHHILVLTTNRCKYRDSMHPSLQLV
jgi:site-specific recombinase XerD